MSATAGDQFLSSMRAAIAVDVTRELWEQLALFVGVTPELPDAGRAAFMTSVLELSGLDQPERDRLVKVATTQARQDNVTKLMHNSMGAVVSRSEAEARAERAEHLRNGGS